MRPPTSLTCTSPSVSSTKSQSHSMNKLKVGASVARQMNAVVVSAGLMAKTVKVRIGVQKWNNHIGKYFSKDQHLLVHDPRSSLRIGDIVSISGGFRASKTVKHVVNSILAPYGEPISARPPVPTAEERIAEREAQRARRLLMKEEKERQLLLLAAEAEQAKVVEKVVEKKSGIQEKVGKGKKGKKSSGSRSKNLKLEA